MYSLQKKVGIVITAFSIWTIAGNIMKYSDFWHLVSIILAAISLALFLGSIFHARSWIRAAQVICIAVVAVFSITSEPEKILDVVSGCFFILVSIALSYRYHFFNKYPVPVVISAIFCVTLSFSIYSMDMVTGAAIGFAVTAGGAILWAIIHDEISELRGVVKKMVKQGDKMDEALSEGRTDHGEIKR